MPVLVEISPVVLEKKLKCKSLQTDDRQKVIRKESSLKLAYSSAELNIVPNYVIVTVVIIL